MEIFTTDIDVSYKKTLNKLQNILSLIENRYEIVFADSVFCVCNDQYKTGWWLRHFTTRSNFSSLVIHYTRCNFSSLVIHYTRCIIESCINAVCKSTYLKLRRISHICSFLCSGLSLCSHGKMLFTNPIIIMKNVANKAWNMFFSLPMLCRICFTK